MRALLLLPLLVGCTEYGYSSQRNKDAFQQSHINTVDIVMVVDNSCSMVEEQDKLASNFEAFIAAFAGVDVDWQIGVVTTDTLYEAYSGSLVGGTDEIVLADSNGRTIDEVAWDAGWPITPGVALQLDPDQTSGTANGSVEAWCLATDSFGDGDLGSPGYANPACSARGPRAPRTPPDALPPPPDAVAPSAGDVVITEFLADPDAVADDVGEWVELTNISEDDIDLSGCTLEDGGRNSFTFPDGTSIAAGGVLVVGRTADGGGAPVDVETGGDMTLNNADLILTDETEGASEIFSEMVAVGVTGSGIEMGLEGARLALSEPLISTRNAGLIRDDANLSLIFVSDEDDYSPYDVNEYYRFFADFKGDAAYRDTGVFNVSAVVGADEPPYDGEPACESVNGTADFGSRYVDLAQRTDGALESICDEDFSPIAAELGLLVSGLEVEFVLSEPADEESLVVSLYEDDTEESFVGELVRDQDYSFDVDKNAVIFSPEQVPPAESWVVAEYRVLATGATQTDEAGR